MADLARTKLTSQRIPAVPVREHLRTLEDGDVVSVFLGGEERAFEELVDRYQGRLLNFVYRTISDRDRAEDLVQEVFIRVYRHIGRFDRSKKFSTWIYTIASNLAKNELRNRSRNPLVLFQTIKAKFEDEVPSSAIGEEIMTLLQSVDQIAYVRFASVYREFRDIDELAKAIDQLRKGGKAK